MHMWEYNLECYFSWPAQQNSEPGYSFCIILSALSEGWGTKGCICRAQKPSSTVTNITIFFFFFPWTNSSQRSTSECFSNQERWERDSNRGHLAATPWGQPERDGSRIQGTAGMAWSPIRGCLAPSSGYSEEMGEKITALTPTPYLVILPRWWKAIKTASINQSKGSTLLIKTASASPSLWLGKCTHKERGNPTCLRAAKTLAKVVNKNRLNEWKSSGIIINSVKMSVNYA